MDSTLYAAASMGFLGSIHCAAMCGPLAIAGCNKSGKLDKRDGALYFLGRTVAYAFVGALFGGAAQMHALHHQLHELQNVILWVVAGGALLHGLRLLWRQKKDPSLVQLGRPQNAVFRFAAKLWPRRGLGLGLATAFLPCGLLMGAWMLAAAAGGPKEGASTMVVFSLASLPGLAAPLLLEKVFAQRLSRLSPAWYGLTWVLLAVWIGARPFLHQHGGH